MTLDEFFGAVAFSIFAAGCFTLLVCGIYGLFRCHKKVSQALVEKIDTAVKLIAYGNLHSLQCNEILNEICQEIGFDGFYLAHNNNKAVMFYKVIQGEKVVTSVVVRDSSSFIIDGKVFEIIDNSICIIGE